MYLVRVEFNPIVFGKDLDIYGLTQCIISVNFLKYSTSIYLSNYLQDEAPETNTPTTVAPPSPTTTTVPTDVMPYGGISMVQGPSITGLNVPLSDSISPSRSRLLYADVTTYLGPTASHLMGTTVAISTRETSTGSGAYSRSNTSTSASSPRYGGTASTMHRQELDEVVSFVLLWLLFHRYVSTSYDLLYLEP